MSRHEPLGLHVGTFQRGAKLGPRLGSVCKQSISISSPVNRPSSRVAVVVVDEHGRTPRGDGPNYWPVNPRDLPHPAGWARGYGRSRGCSPGTMSPKRAVGSIAIWLLCSVDSFCSLFMHVRVVLSAPGRFLKFCCSCSTTPNPHGQHMLKPPRIGGVRARPYLARTMLNFLHLGKLSISADDCLVSHAPSTPTRPPNPIAIVLAPRRADRLMDRVSRSSAYAF